MARQQRPLVVITGSRGFIGSAVARALLDRYRVVGLDRPSQKEPQRGVAAIDVDMTSADSVRQSIATLRREHGDALSSVIHLAAYYDFSGDDSDQYDEVTVRGTERLLRELQELSVEQLVFSSTMLVHAPTEPGRPIDEDSPIDPKWPYPVSKVRTEAVIRAQRGSIPAVILRIAGGSVTDCLGEPLRYNKPDPVQPHGILACAPGVAEHVLGIITPLYEGAIAQRKLA